MVEYIGDSWVNVDCFENEGCEIGFGYMVILLVFVILERFFIKFELLSVEGFVSLFWFFFV